MLVAKRMKLADILVVDPDPDMVDVITAVLEGEGYSCRSAANGQEALEACLRAVPAVVLMDLQLPVMNGWICARWLRARYDNTLAIVIMTTTRYVEEHRAQTTADGVLTKPFALDQLVRVLGRFVEPADSLSSRRRLSART
jgi:two-component system chemotaxis response regulator CheY